MKSAIHGQSRKRPALALLPSRASELLDRHVLRDTMMIATPHDVETNLFRALRRHPGKMALVFLTTLVATFALNAVSKRLFSSEAKLFVRLGRESVTLDPTATTGETMPVQDVRENEINSVYDLLKSRTILEHVVDSTGAATILGVSPEPEPETPQIDVWRRINPLAKYSQRDEAIKRLRKWLTVEVVRKSNVINVSCIATSPALAEEMLQQVIDYAREQHARVNRTDGSYEFFVEQARQQHQQLTETESKLRDLKDRTGLSSIEAQRGLQLDRIANLENQRLGVVSALAALEAEHQERQRVLGGLAEVIVTSETTGMPQTAAANMRQQLYTLELREKEALAKYHDDTFFVRQIRDQIAAARAVLEAEPNGPQVTKGTNTAHQTTQLAAWENEAKRSSLRAQTEALDVQVADARDGLHKLHCDELSVAELEREIDLAATNYRKYAENCELARIDQALEQQRISNINVLQAPSHSITPARPRNLLNLGLGTVVGMVLAVGLALGLEMRERTAQPTASMDNDQFWQLCRAISERYELAGAIRPTGENGLGPDVDGAGHD